MRIILLSTLFVYFVLRAESIIYMGDSGLIQSSVMKEVNMTEKSTEDIGETFLAVPSVKLVFCFIHKNACTQFNLLCNALNGLHSDEIYASSVLTSELQEIQVVRRDGLESIFKDPSWTKAVFLREPLHRLTSAFRSKCEPPQEDSGKNCLDSNFTKLVDALPSRGHSNKHYMPQADFCRVGNATLSDMISDYDFIGQITEDYSKVHEQVMGMLKHALAKRDSNSFTSGAIEEAVNKSFVPLTFADFKEGIFGNLNGLGGDEVLNSGEEQFPLDHPGGHASHITSGTGALPTEDYYSPQSAAKAMSFYAPDYDLPGLKRPAWVA